MIHVKIFCLVLCCFCIGSIYCKGELKTLDDSSWNVMLEGEWMVEFFAPWCPACQQLEPVWRDFSKWSDDLGIKVGNVDVTQSAGLSGRFMITALPTIYHVKDGVFRQYRGARDKESFFSFVEEKKWQSLDPVSSWKSPQSYAMTTVSYFFKLSMFLRSAHSTLVEDYGIPNWGSYAIFGVATIVIGALLGLIIVCILDSINRPRSPDYHRLPDDKAGENDQENDIIKDSDDIIKSDAPETRKRKVVKDK